MKVNVRTMAKEMMEQTKNSILSQASQAMLAQANQATSRSFTTSSLILDIYRDSSFTRVSFIYGINYEIMKLAIKLSCEY